MFSTKLVRSVFFVVFFLPVLLLGAGLVLLAEPPSYVVSDGHKDHKVTDYGAVILASDGKTYRVTMTQWNDDRTYEFDWVSKDAEFVSADATSYPGSIYRWGTITGCKEFLKTDFSKTCGPTPKLEAMVQELASKVRRRENVLGTFEISWSWSMDTKHQRAELEK